MKSTTNDTRNKKPISKRDIAIILALSIAASVSFIIFSASRKPGSNAVITIDNETKITMNLTEKKKTESFELEGAVIEVRNGKIGVIGSDCPDKICVHTGFISKKGEKIVCLPKKLIIEIE